MSKLNKNLIKLMLLTFIFALSGLILSGCSINAKQILKVYNQTSNTNSYGYEQTCVINFKRHDFTSKSSYLKINGSLLELKIIENSLGDLNDDSAIITHITHCFYDENFKYEKQGDIFVKTTDTIGFNNDNKVNLKESYLQNVKLTTLKEENKTLLEAKVKNDNINDVFLTLDITNANVKIIYNNKTKKVEQIKVTYLSKNNNQVTITTNYFQTAQEITIPSI